METLHAGAVVRDCSFTAKSDPDPKAAAIIGKFSRVLYLLEQHNIAVATLSRTLVELQVELDRTRRGR